MMTPEDVLSVEIGLINQCVLKCRLCLREEDVAKQLPKNVSVDYETTINFLNKLPNLRQLDFVGSVSEPTLHKRIHDFVKYAKHRNLQVRFSTNGNTFTNDWWANFGKIFDSKDIIRFAVDGSTQEIHEKYRVGGKLSKVLSNHRAFKTNTEAKTVLQNLLFDYNIDDQENIKKLFIQENFDICEFTHTGDANYEDDPKLVRDNILPVNDLRLRYKKRNSSNGEFFKNVICKSSKENQIYINHMGCVLPCDDMEETTFVDRENNITIYDHTLEECFEHVNSIIRKRFVNRTCEICCGPANQKLHIDYPIIQYNREGKKAILHKFREIGDFN